MVILTYGGRTPWVSDGEGVVGVSTTPIKTKKKIQKKIREVDGGVKISPILIGKAWKRQ